ncbi:glycoside hydrolase family 76 protein [Streptomyces sp. NPDC002765]
MPSTGGHAESRLAQVHTRLPHPHRRWTVPHPLGSRRAAATASATAVLGALLTIATPSPADAAATAGVCNKYCDARDPAAAASDRTPVSSTLYGRTVRLHLSDNDVMGWASIDDGNPGDEVWLDRSFDGGRTWSGGSKLGDTTTPTGSRGWRTLMYNVDDWNSSGVGALRACGKAGDRPEITCTAWARVDWNAWSRGTAAATALMMSYDRGTGLFGGNGWWTAANALTAVLDNARVSGMPSYRYAIASTYDKNLGAQGGNFTNDYLDDTGWWGLAWVAAYDATGDSRYLNTARADADHMNAYWTATCGGGVLWNETKTYKNAITNELFLQLNAALHNRISGDAVYLARARNEWAWFRQSGMINADHMINDGLTDACANNGQTTWTYNQGVVLGGLTELYRATSDSSLLTTARQLADASTVRLQTGGVLREPGESDSCTGDGPSFKGAYVRGLGRLDAQLSDHPYAATLDRWADAAYANDRNSLDQYGPHWNGGTGTSDYGCQQSALDLLNAAGQ